MCNSLPTKASIGKVDEILGPINNVMFTIKPGAGIQATSFNAGDKVCISGDKLLPIERFLPKPKEPAGPKKKGAAGGRKPGVGRGGARGRGAPRGAPRGGGFSSRGGPPRGRGGGGFRGAPRGGGGGFGGRGRGRGRGF